MLLAKEQSAQRQRLKDKARLLINTWGQAQSTWYVAMDNEENTAMGGLGKYILPYSTLHPIREIFNQGNGIIRSVFSIVLI